jgi:voltage-gated potassium channel Kch
VTRTIRDLLNHWWRNGANLVAVLIFYFSAPVGDQHSPASLALGVILSLAAAGAVGLLLLRQARQPSAGLRAVHLLLALEIVLAAFSLSYYALAINTDGQMVGIATRLDALYFSTTTMTTVGYGDIHAAGQVARAVVTLHLAFNLVFVAVFANLVRTRLQGPEPPAQAG